MSEPLISVSLGAIKRAELVDPHLQRCLVENTPRTGAVEVAHVFDRESSPRIVRCIEWAWGMREDSLNLDSRRNIFFLSSSMNALYKEKRWAFLPEEDMVKHYLLKVGIPQRRGEVVDLKGDTFKYKLVPLDDMEDIHITRQATDGANTQVTVYHYPFEDFPVITSHIHPKYAILHLGSILSDPRISTKGALLVKYPWLRKLRQVRSTWASQVPDYSKRHASYQSIYDSDSPLEPYYDDGPCTPLRRIPALNNIHGAARDLRDLTNSASESQSSGTGYRCHPAHKATKRKYCSDDSDNCDPPTKKRLFTSMFLDGQERRDDMHSVKWTSQRIATWAEDCSLSPVPPSKTIKPPLRRSARIKAKSRKI